jgi:hypothetical protein
LKRVIKSTGFTNSFAGITRHWNDVGVEIHHLFPFELFKAGPDQPQIFKRMAAVFQWHAGDPLMNGLIIPKKLASENIFLEGAIDASDNLFHGNHPKYNEWVQDALIKIDNKTADINLSGKIEQLRVLLISHLEDAYSHNKSINNYFKDLPKLDIDLF